MALLGDVNLPSERLVLTFGVGIAAAAYGYWMMRSVRLGVDEIHAAPLRAGIVLGAFFILALVLRVAARVNRQDGEADE